MKSFREFINLLESNAEQLEENLYQIREKNTRSLVEYMNHEREIYGVINKHVNQKMQVTESPLPPTLDKPY